MTAEKSPMTDSKWEEWLNDTHASVTEAMPHLDEVKLANCFVEISDLIDQGLYPMTREGFSMFMRDAYAAYLLQEVKAGRMDLEIDEERA